MGDPTHPEEYYIVVDIEASGPTPGPYALLSIGACTLGQPRQTFYVELKPDREAFTAEAMAVNGLSLETLAEQGLPPHEALERFAGWLGRVVPPGARPVLAAFNAPFDWMFVNDCFWRYLGYNPFGHSALDIRTYYMGRHRTCWGDAAYRRIAHRYGQETGLTHHALADAVDEARLFEAMLADTACARDEDLP